MMRFKWLFLGMCALLCAGISGCSQATLLPDAYPITAPPATAQPAGIHTPAPGLASPAFTATPVENSTIISTLSETVAPGLKELLLQTQKETVESARKDLAQRLGLSVDDISVLSVIGLEFSPEAFYCRTAKGRIAKEESPQVISGETILLAAQGDRYEYHASHPLVIFCRQLL
jgi:hypothetical protein